MADFVDLDKWEPGEDVDDDALVREELLRYRQIIKDQFITDTAWQKIWNAIELADNDIPDCPDCVQGKHVNCSRISWNNTYDEESSCPCYLRGHKPPKKET